MFRAAKRHRGLTRAFASLWRNWTLAVGVLTLVTVLSPLVPRHTLPLITLALGVGLRLYERQGRHSGQPRCYRFTRQVWLILLFSSAAMAILNVIYMRAETEITGQPINYELPFLSILVIAPISAIVNGLALLRSSAPICRDCPVTLDDADLGFVGRLFRREWIYQTRLGLLLALGSLVADWAYYFFYFSTINFSKPDYFFYIWLPTGIFIASIVYLAIRYYSLWVYYCHNDEAGLVNTPSHTALRFLVISGDEMLLCKLPTSTLFDTPVAAHVAYMERPNILEATNAFRSLTNIKDFELRLIYVTPDPVTFRNIFHYFAFVSPELAENKAKIMAEGHGSGDEGQEEEWCTGMALRQLFNHHRLAAPMRREIERIYRIATAWKTYDINGKRLYAIKNYHPTFHLRDLRGMEDVDFTDKRWLGVDRLNADKHFFRLRRLWRRIITGISNATDN